LSDAVARVAGRRPVSATVGDLPPDAGALAAATRATAATGVDIVKLGFFSGANHRSLAWDLAPLASDGILLVAVLMADREPDLDVAATLAGAGFLGVMLDTADKGSGGLLRHLDLPILGRFVDSAHDHGIMAGLAGSLRFEDVATLAPLGPDYLGFRGALCRGGRASALDAERVSELRRQLDALTPPDAEVSTCHGGAAANIVIG
jgi:(5-formylfuran-3-yl)methyl phosphate synthase